MANLRVDKITSTETFETTGSVQFDGSGDSLSTSESGFTNIASTDAFTVEAFVYFNDLDNYSTIFASSDGSFTTGGFKLEIYQSKLRVQANSFDSSDYNSGATTLSTRRWYHIAFSRTSDGNVYIFLDGVLDFSGGGAFEVTWPKSVRIGAKANNSEYLDGFVSNLRFCYKKALYTTNFKTPMRELEVTPETVLLACQSKTDATLEKTGKTLTANGNAVASELTPGILTPVPKAGAGSAITGSVEFNGTNDYLSVQSSTDFDFGTGDFTIELYANLGNLTNRNIFARNDSNPSNTGILLWHNGSGQLEWQSSVGDSTGVITVTTPLSLHEWAHIAVSRKSNTTRLFANGVLIGSTSDNTDISGSSVLNIGSTFAGTLYYVKGFISNLRMVKGTALYTDDFIPPTRELKKVPGTVLLCCQDPDNPLTEATGKTITGYGDLQRADGVELITNGHFTTNTDNWTAVNGASLSTSSGQIVLTGDGSTAGGGATQGFTTVIGQKYVLKYEAFSGTISAGQIRIGTSSNSFNITFDNSVSASAHDDITFTATSTTTYVTLGLNAGLATSGTFKYDNVSVTLVDGSNKGSNFTPQVGDDRKVTFEGVTKINTENYFYLPTGNTESRDRGGGVRGVFVRGQSDTPSPALVQTIEYINISSTGNAIDFGDAAAAAGTVGACSDSTRGIQGGGQTPSGPTVTADILKLTIASTGTAVDSGADLLSAANYVEALSSSTRAVFVGGSPPGSNVLQFTEIQSLGNTVDFGDLNNSVFGEGTCCDGVRGVIFGGTTGPTPGDRIDNIDYITVSSKGDAQDFGNLGAARAQGSGFSNKIRGIYAGGRYQPQNNIIEYVTIATTGDAKDFGDLISQASRDGGGTCSSTRGVHAGGDANPSPTADVNTIQYITIMSMGNAFDFGDLTERKTHIGACSNGHGGLG